MRMNIENCIRHCGAKSTYMYALKQLVINLKELKTAFENGDNKSVEEFFKCYVFDKD